MEVNNPKRGRNFDLEKPRDRRFDLTKDAKEAIPTPPPSNPNGRDNGIGWKKPLVFLIIVAVLGGITYCAYSLYNNGRESDGSDEKIVATVTEDSTQLQNKGTINDKDSVNKQLAKEKEINTKQEEPNPGVEQSKVKEDKEQQNQQASITSHDVKSYEPISGTLEEKAKRVIRGDFGNGQVRKDRLGDEYAEIQSKVNEMYRNGDLYF